MSDTAPELAPDATPTAAADELDLAGLATAAQQFLERVVALAPRPANPIRDRLLAHLGVGHVTELASRRDKVPLQAHVNLQLALDAWCDGRDHEVIGLPPDLAHWHGASVTALLGANPRIPPLEPVPPGYVELPVDAGRTLRCVMGALYVVRVGTAPVVAMVLRVDRGMGAEIVVEATSPDDAAAEAFLVDVARLRDELNAFRGKVVSFDFSQHGELGIAFHPLPVIARDDVVLPAADLAAIERHVIGVADHADALVAAGHQLKRGLLLHGPPGTGKTYTVMYLCNRMPGRTTVLLTGVGEGALGPAIALARRLQPSTVVLEDVDLVAMERSYHPGGQHPLLFQLLNEMDGLDADADIAFVLTTNRPELLEPALAQRPGRVDLAVEISLPDADRRRLLLARYFRDTPTDPDLDLDPFVAPTDGQPASFVKELARRALLEALGSGEAVVRAAHVEAALADLTARQAALREVTGS
jgi:cell division protease FtsH